MRAATQPERKLHDGHGAVLHALRVDDVQLRRHLGVVARNAHDVTVALLPTALARHETRLLEALHVADEERTLGRFRILEVETLVAVRDTTRTIAAGGRVVRLRRIGVAHVAVAVRQRQIPIVHAREHAVRHGDDFLGEHIVLRVQVERPALDLRR